jgi:hypothetical protein
MERLEPLRTSWFVTSSFPWHFETHFVDITGDMKEVSKGRVQLFIHYLSLLGIARALLIYTDRLQESNHMQS